jgi:hypothetical protein
MLNALFGNSGAVNAKTGTTAPIYVARVANPQPVKPGEYFFVKIHSAQAAFRGSIFNQVKQLVVTSRVNLNHPVLGNEEIFAIQRSREVKKDRAEQLGLSQNLISLVPATMTHVTISIEFILDQQNNLALLAGLINDDSFLTAVSLAPGAVAIAKTIGGLAQKVIQTFVPAQQRQPILQFVGDFNLGAGANDLVEGYYAILGTRSENDPIPSSATTIEIGQSGLLLGGKEISQFSYVVLDVTRVPARTRELNSGAVWDKKLREAESLAQEVADDPFADDNQHKEVWRKCSALLQEARTLLLADPTYAESEASSIYKTIYKACADLITGKAGAGVAKGVELKAAIAADQARLGIAEGEDLDRIASEYAKQTEDARRILQESNLL